MVAWAGCLPMPLLRHHLARFSAKLLAVNPSRVPPQHKPPSGEKSGLGFTLSEGMVSSLYQRSIQISAPISHGSSASPVMDEGGRVVGGAVGIDSHGRNLNF